MAYPGHAVLFSDPLPPTLQQLRVPGGLLIDPLPVGSTLRDKLIYLELGPLYAHGI